MFGYIFSNMRFDVYVLTSCKISFQKIQVKYRTYMYMTNILSRKYEQASEDRRQKATY